jgi:hypothetical protein
MGDRHETEHQSFGHPDELREPPTPAPRSSRSAAARSGGLAFEPGWRWSNHVTGTDSREAPHFHYHVAGRLGTRMEAGTKTVARTGRHHLAAHRPTTPGSSGRSRRWW